MSAVEKNDDTISDCTEQPITEMDVRDRIVLEKCRSKIIKDLDIKHVIDDLIAMKLVDDRNYEQIKSQPSTQDSAEVLLDVLPSKGSKALGHFIEILKEDYEWLAEDLEDAINNQEDVLDSSSTSDNVKNAEDALKDILNRGGVPNRPSQHIFREKELKDVRDILSALDNGEFLAIHGMAGSGKTLLAAEVLRDPEITLKYFPDGVFWFRVGMMDQEKLLNKLKILLEKLNIGVNISTVNTVEYALELLRKQFLDHFKNSLLILDDVWKGEIIKQFEICAKVLVTTRDRTIMDTVNGQAKIVTLTSGFTLDESLKLFSSYVDIPVEYLPEEAKDIHNECQGSPMVISMIGGLISESGKYQNTQRQSGRWGHYLNSLQSRKLSKVRKTSAYKYNSLLEAVSLSIENLDDFRKKLYKQLAVFLDDVGIPPKMMSKRRSFRFSNPWFESWSRNTRQHVRKGIKFGGSYDPQKNKDLFQRYNYKGMHLPFEVLMTYWDMNEYEVDDIMTDFLKKSLCQSEFDPILDRYVFNIHDLQLEYLKSLFDNEHPKAEIELHTHFLDQYFKKARFQYGNIQDDSYIFYNLGYHLFKSEQYHLFPQVYLDLHFVEAMLRATSSVDLLNDYKRYGDHIIGTVTLIRNRGLCLMKLSTR